MITERPAEADDRAVPGQWEGDLILGLHKSAIGTVVERTTRFTMLLLLPPMDGHGDLLRVKNGPPLDGHGAEAVRDEIARVITTLPEQLRRSLTWDEGAELLQDAQLRIDTGLAIYFCGPDRVREHLPRPTPGGLSPTSQLHERWGGSEPLLNPGRFIEWRARHPNLPRQPRET